MNESDKAMASLASVDEEAIRTEIADLEAKLSWMRPLAELVSMAWRDASARKSDPAAPAADGPVVSEATPAAPDPPSRSKPGKDSWPLAKRRTTRPADKAGAAPAGKADDDDAAKQQRLLLMLADGPLAGSEARSRFGERKMGKLPAWMSHPWFVRQGGDDGRVMLALSTAGRQALADQGKIARQEPEPARPAPSRPAPKPAAAPAPTLGNRARALRLLAQGVHTEEELRRRFGLDDGGPFPLEGDTWFFRAEEGGEITWRLSAEGREAFADGAGKETS